MTGARSRPSPTREPVDARQRPRRSATAAYSFSLSTDCANPHTPGYPLTILAASVPVRLFVHDEMAALRLSGQLASNLAGVLLVVPMFFLGAELFNRRVGFWAAAIFQCLPVGLRATADILSEAVFLWWVALALRRIASLVARTAHPDAEPGAAIDAGRFQAAAQLADQGPHQPHAKPAGRADVDQVARVVDHVLTDGRVPNPLKE